MTQNHPKLSERLIKSLVARNDAHQWEKLMATLLQRLELSPGERNDAKLAYERLGNRIAATLGLSQTEVKVYPQGSMRTQTTISPRGNQKFDLDIVVELQGIHYMLSPDSEGMFADFGKALEGNESVTGVPEGKRRCWRLQYPGKPFYFDVTPAVPDLARSTGASLKVRDPDTRWSPSNPEDFANWFCERADKRFGFQQRAYDAVIKANSEIRPLPEAQVGLDDILRRTIQLMKLHRDNLYWNAEDWRKDGQPISVIIVTLATKAFERLHSTRYHEFTSPIEVVLAIVEEMPNHFDSGPDRYCVANPMLPKENFADRWNNDNGVRAREFQRWHKQLEEDLEALLYQSSSSPDESRIRRVFGGVGVEAWKQSQPVNDILGGLLASGLVSNPSSVVPHGSKDTLG
ncbi:nucleotidyltransferase [Achromobacter sp. PD1]|uniref:nucleotidyltransferase domain-containing protein n=1 Tax=Achromobacter sp. PD1 TaxID=3399125 RepID=UPI003AF77D05